MPRKIQILPEDVSKAIAAGEVIERPASVVKELMENAIDAGASEIIVELKAGGLLLIHVVDNGEGIDREDAPIALQRYATSKIKRAEDLYDIHTLGFRGEALPSIASVSQMILRTRVAGSISGTKVVCEGGEIKSISEIGCPIGTEVEIKNIFYNLPVKRKFLKSIRSELGYSLNQFLRLSLSHPSISFKFIHDDRMLHEHPKTESSLVRIEAILGREITSHLQRCEFEEREIKVFGFVSLPPLSKGNADGIYLYVNGRFVKDRVIYKAITETYQHTLPSGKYPIIILFLALPPFVVDVNVHPTKAEVKFRDPERVFQAVMEALHSAIGITPYEGDLKEGAYSKGVPVSSSFIHSSSPPLPFPKEEEKRSFLTVKEPHPLEWEIEKKIPWRILGQMLGTFILCEGEKGLIIIDQHAAHERLLFEKYKSRYEMQSISLEKFLIPIPMELSAEESFILSSYLEDFQSMGFEIDPVGEQVYAIRSQPSFIDQKDPKEMVREILDELSFLKRERRKAETIHTILVTLACHNAIRGNLILRKEEMEELVESLYPFNLSATCPHGRPIFFQLPLEELNKQFRRR